MCCKNHVYYKIMYIKITIRSNRGQGMEPGHWFKIPCHMDIMWPKIPYLNSVHYLHDLD